MKEFLFSLLNKVNALSFITIDVYLLGLMGLIILGVFAFSQRYSENTIYCLFMGTLASCIFGVIFFEVELGKVERNSSNYKVGMCFEEKIFVNPNLEYDIARLEQKVKELTVGINSAQEIQANNSAELKSQLVVAEQELTAKQELLTGPVVAQFVVIKQDKNVHIVFNAKKKLVDASFYVGRSAYQVECSPELNEVVRVFQTTGNLVAAGTR
jgi:hypothetical protein